LKEQKNKKMASQIRNFVIISHIDHGKSTLADRFLEITKTVEIRKMKEQILDSMDLERERGITIKLQPARMNYEYNGTPYQLNLIDTPGHVDFSYEVSRSLEAVEGAVLLVDATQGVQAQTLANLELAKKAGLKIIPAVNKIDLPDARPEEVAFEIAEVLGSEADEVRFISAKTGEGVKKLLEEIIEKVPAPREAEVNYPRALIFDSFYDDYRGVVVYVRVFDGEIKKGDKILFYQLRKQSEASDVGSICLGLSSAEKLSAGEIGFIVTTLKDVSQARVGDSVTLVPAKDDFVPLEGYEESKSMVYAEVFTASGEDYPRLRDGLAKLKLSDSSVHFEPISSKAFGFGFRCGFLGLLHLEIVKERLEREYDLDLVVTTPTVDYKKDAEGITEPYVRAEIIAPKDYLGQVIEILQARRGEQIDIKHLEEKVIIIYELPLAEVIIDFYDALKSATRGYGSVSYDLIDWRHSDLVKLDFLVAEEEIDAFSRMVYRGFAERVARNTVEKMKEFIPRQNFEIKIQAAIGAKIIASARIAPFRKDVTEKLYGGDVTRKRKLLEKQKKGKKKMARLGRVDVPTEVFIKLLKY
jgi:GTP-binding protein LepA